MAALISTRFDKQKKINYLIGAPLRRGAVRVTVIFFFLAKGRVLDMKDIRRRRMEFSNSGFKFCLSPTICSLSDCELQIPLFHFKPLK